MNCTHELERMKAIDFHLFNYFAFSSGVQTRPCREPVAVGINTEVPVLWTGIQAAEEEVEEGVAGVKDGVPPPKIDARPGVVNGIPSVVDNPVPGPVTSGNGILNLAGAHFDDKRSKLICWSACLSAINLQTTWNSLKPRPFFLVPPAKSQA